MKADKISPCVCCGRKTNGGDSVYFGMPMLRVCGGKPETYLEAFCPKCGRGSLLQFKSAYKALKEWNSIQREQIKLISQEGRDNENEYQGKQRSD